MLCLNCKSVAHHIVRQLKLLELVHSTAEHVFFPSDVAMNCSQPSFACLAHPSHVTVHTHTRTHTHIHTHTCVHTHTYTHTLTHTHTHQNTHSKTRVKIVRGGQLTPQMGMFSSWVLVLPIPAPMSNLNWCGPYLLPLNLHSRSPTPPNHTMFGVMESLWPSSTTYSLYARFNVR